MKECHLCMYLKPFRSAKWWTFISHWSNFHFPIFLLPKSKCLIYSVSVYLCFPLCKVWWSKANYRRKAMSSNLNLFLSKAQKHHSTGNCDFLSSNSFINVVRSSWSTNCAAESSKPLVMLSSLGPTLGTKKAKFEKISIFRAIQLWFLRSLVSTIWCEANKSNLRREERPIGSHAVKMLRDLLLLCLA